jgi:integrase
LPDDPTSSEFLRRLGELNQQLEKKPRSDGRGTVNSLIATYKSSPEFGDKADKTKKDYRRYLDILGEVIGDKPVSWIDREVVMSIRDGYADKPRTANYLIQVLSLLLTFAGNRRNTFLLPQYWVNHALNPKRLKTGDGYDPWEEYQIEAFQNCHPKDTFERVLFEAFLWTGQRGEDIAAMTRHHLHGDMIHVKQMKTGERVPIPLSNDLREVLLPWLKGHDHFVLFPTERGHDLKPDHMRHIMRAACRKAGLPDSCTLHGLRYAFTTRADEIGIAPRDVEAIVGHRTMEMWRRYSQKERSARLTITNLNQATGGQKKNDTH